jgi:hypothetical protein
VAIAGTATSFRVTSGSLARSETVMQFAGRSPIAAPLSIAAVPRSLSAVLSSQRATPASPAVKAAKRPGTIV